MSYRRIACVLAVLWAVSSVPASAQFSDEEARRLAEQINRATAAAEKAPVSPNGRPMEALWSYAPEAPDGRVGETPGPYAVSHWGNIVVRARREGDRTISALNTVQCGRKGDPSTLITLLGTPPEGLCDSLKPVTPGRMLSFDVGEHRLFGATTGWTMIEFAQKLGDTTFSGFPAAVTSGPPQVGVTSTGAFFLDQGGVHVFYAPGETVEVLPGISIVVPVVTTFDEIEAELTAGGTSSGPRANAFDYAVLLVVLGGAGYGVRRWLRRRRAGAVSTAN